MKTHLSIFAVILFALLITFSCKKDAPKVIPTISTSAPTNITSSTAACGGTISADGGAPITSRGVCWSVIQNPTTSDNKTSDGTGIGNFTSSISGLTPGTEYYVRAFATNSVGTAYGNQVVSTTMSALPTITTIAVTNITTTTATSGGFISFEGGSPVTSRGVCFSSINENPTITNSIIPNGNGPSSFACAITGLSRGGKYYIRAYATNSMGTSYGNVLSFTTLADKPTITTSSITNITETSAVGGGNITSDGGAKIESRGVCWSTNQNPTIANSKTVESSVLSIFTSSINGLIPYTTYYVRAYATNSAGTAYGTEISFYTYRTLTDIDGNAYKTVVIGTQTWMAENLKTKKYSNGDPIETTTPSTLDISNTDTYPTPKYQWAYNGEEEKIATYGRLYTWFAATDSRNICPSGWHVPTKLECNTLIAYLGGENVAGGKLKDASTKYWNSPNTGATNSSGFTALPSGYRAENGRFYALKATGYLWNSDVRTSIYRNSMVLDTYWNNVAFQYVSQVVLGQSVRCVKDN